jgi:two-component system NtrC family sensor kinase
MEPTDVHQLTKRVLFLLKHKMDLASVSAKVTLDESMVPVLCDPGQLEQALLALCVNGIEAMADGGELTIDVRKEGDAGACIVVRDQGIGIPPDVLPRIYEPFFTSKNQGDGKGLGLGLSVVYGIVQHHRGTITVDSEQGHGTTFTMVFPGAAIEGEQA